MADVLFLTWWAKILLSKMRMGFITFLHVTVFTTLPMCDTFYIMSLCKVQPQGFFGCILFPLCPLALQLLNPPHQPWLGLANPWIECEQPVGPFPTWIGLISIVTNLAVVFVVLQVFLCKCNWLIPFSSSLWTWHGGGHVLVQNIQKAAF